MGFYIEGPTFEKEDFVLSTPEAKARQLAEAPTWPPPPGRAYLCVVHNPTFEACAVAYSAEELERFVDDGTSRLKEWLEVDAAWAHAMSRAPVV